MRLRDLASTATANAAAVAALLVIGLNARSFSTVGAAAAVGLGALIGQSFTTARARVANRARLNRDCPACSGRGHRIVAGSHRRCRVCSGDGRVLATDAKPQ